MHVGTLPYLLYSYLVCGTYLGSYYEKGKPGDTHRPFKRASLSMLGMEGWKPLPLSLLSSFPSRANPHSPQQSTTEISPLL